DCYFYHTMEIPGHGLVEGEWDLRAAADAYLGGVDFRGRRVLEIGTASGFLCFTMERRGAEVVAFDLSPEHAPDLIPSPDTDPAPPRPGPPRARPQADQRLLAVPPGTGVAGAGGLRQRLRDPGADRAGGRGHLRLRAAAPARPAAGADAGPAAHVGDRDRHRARGGPLAPQARPVAAPGPGPAAVPAARQAQPRDHLVGPHARAGAGP